jgi:trk system potassium uptake protein TrkH
MNYRAVVRVLGFMALAVGAAMLVPTALALFDGSGDFVGLLISAAIPIVVGGVGLLRTRGNADLRVKEGFAIVTFGWLVAAMFGALPYCLSGACRSPIDAFFESMSGFTTTGATIFTDIESLPRGILLWRSFTQWLGGMGIVVLSVAVLPMLGVGGMQLFKAEVPGPTTDRLSPRIQSTASILWKVYFGVTVAEIVLLLFGGMDLFEAVCHSFCTVSTGGFSTRNGSVGAFGSGYIDWVIIFFMFIAGANFSLHYWILHGRWRTYVQNEEFRFYGAVAATAVLLLAINLIARTDHGTLLSIRLAAFQAISILTSTGFGTADYLLWGFGAQMLLFSLMFIGGCAGSTAGGMKVMRLVLLAKHGVRTLRKSLHPQAVFNVWFSGKLVPDEVMMKVLGFFLLYIFIFAAVGLGVAATGVDLTTALGATIATLSNIGPGLGGVGPTSNYASIPATAEVLLSICMLLGRLELYTMLVVFMPMFWRRQ